MNIQDRDAFDSFQEIVEDIVNNVRKKALLSRGYILNEKMTKLQKLTRSWEGTS